MKANYWHDRWENSNIGFHQDQPEKSLTAHFATLNLPKGSSVFVPLCGKSLDIHWLLAQGYSVIGAELSAIATKQLFEELQLTPDLSTMGKLTRYQAEQLTVFVGDIFDLSLGNTEQIDAIYDRAALIALPPELRKQYTQHLTSITQKAPQLLITYQYQADNEHKPPFSVDENEINAHYGKIYGIKQLDLITMDSKRAKNEKAEQRVWLLKTFNKLEKRLPRE